MEKQQTPFPSDFISSKKGCCGLFGLWANNEYKFQATPQGKCHHLKFNFTQPIFSFFITPLFSKWSRVRTCGHRKCVSDFYFLDANRSASCWKSTPRAPTRSSWYNMWLPVLRGFSIAHVQTTCSKSAKWESTFLITNFNLNSIAFEIDSKLDEGTSQACPTNSSVNKCPSPLISKLKAMT